MKKITILIIALLSIAIALFIQSCSSTQLVSSWSEPALSIKAFHKILVVGLMGEKDPELRQDMEIDMVNVLAARGIHAYSSHVVYGPKGFQEKDPRSKCIDGYYERFNV